MPQAYYAASSSALRAPAAAHSVTFVKSWWSLVIRGLAAIALGLITVVWHGLTVPSLTAVFFGYAVVDGLVGLAAAMRAAQEHKPWQLLLGEALVGVVTAIVIVALPGLAYFTLLYIVAAWALATGALEIASALRIRRHVRGELLLLLSGLASVTLGALMLVLPLTGPSDISVALGAYAFVFGALLLALGIRLRRLAAH